MDEGEAMWLKRFFENLFGKEPSSELDRVLQSAGDADALITVIVPEASSRRRGLLRAIEAVHEEWKKKFDKDVAQSIFSSWGALLTVYLSEIISHFFLIDSTSLLVRAVVSAAALIVGLILGAILFVPLAEEVENAPHAYWGLFCLNGAAALAGIWLGWPFAVPFALVAGFGAWSVTRHIGRKTPRPPPEAIRERLGAYFKNLLEEHRERALGEQSEFARARIRLERARDEAEQALEYWHKRAYAEGSIQAVNQNKEIAQQIFFRLTDALASLERQRETIAAFFKQCDARISDITRGADDFVESARLERLLRETDEILDGFEGIAVRAASTFIGDTRRLHEALTLLYERVLLSGVKGDMEAIEVLAEKVIRRESENELSFRKIEAVLAGEAVA